MRSLFRIIALSVALLFGATFSYAQHRYIEIGVAPGLSLFRDKATSPLFYRGSTLTLVGAWHYSKNSTEKLASISYTFGNHNNKYNNTNNSAKFYNLEFNFSHLYQLNSFSSNRYKTKIGAGVVSTINIRENKALMNNSLGVENISNLLFSTKITRNIFTLKQKQSKGSPTMKKISAPINELSLLLNLGVVNFNYRPGYAYNYMPSIGGSNIRSMTDHHLSLNGLRLSTGIEYSKSLSNKNILRLSYLFDAYSAPGKYEPFNYAKHSLKFSILFNCNSPLK